MVTAFVAELRGGSSDARSVGHPLVTVTASGNHHVRLTPVGGTWSDEAGPPSDPHRTLTTPESYALVTSYYGQGQTLPADDAHPHLAFVLADVRPTHKVCNQIQRARPLSDALRATIGQRYERRFVQFERPALAFFGEGGASKVEEIATTGRTVAGRGGRPPALKLSVPRCRHPRLSQAL